MKQISLNLTNSADNNRDTNLDIDTLEARPDPWMEGRTVSNQQ